MQSKRIRVEVASILHELDATNSGCIDYKQFSQFLNKFNLDCKKECFDGFVIKSKQRLHGQSQIIKDKCSTTNVIAIDSMLQDITQTFEQLASTSTDPQNTPSIRHVIHTTCVNQIKLSILIINSTKMLVPTIKL